MKWRGWTQLVAALIIAAICFYIGKLALPVVQEMTPAIAWTLTVVIIVVLVSIGLGVPAAIFISLKSLHTHHYVKEIEARKLAVTERGFIQGYITRGEQLLIPQVVAHSVEVPGTIHIEEDHSMSADARAADWRERLAWEKLALDKEKLRLLSAPAAVAPDVPGPCLFSDVLSNFTPSMERIFLGYLPGKQPVFVAAADLCHVALAGATGGGKTSLIRLLSSQLCAAGADVIFLNPHYTPYDIRAKEDWTPFEPYLKFPPCREYVQIEAILRNAATQVLPKRLARYNHSREWGGPYFIVLDELPAIQAHIPGAHEYIAAILREGRKVDLYLIVASQDFLVSTIAPKGGGGAVRECYRTAFYVGGDAQTARILLDVQGNADDGALGKGVVKLRSGKVVSQASYSRVPYVDNQALYRLLGPSTYVPATATGSLDAHQTPETPPGKEAGVDYDERPDARIIDADSGGMEALQPRPGNVRTFPGAHVDRPVEPTQATSDERPKYILSEKEIGEFIAAYRSCGNKDRALRSIGKGSNYREAAERIIEVYALRAEA